MRQGGPAPRCRSRRTERRGSRKPFPVRGLRLPRLARYSAPAAGEARIENEDDRARPSRGGAVVVLSTDRCCATATSLPDSDPTPLWVRGPLPAVWPPIHCRRRQQHMARLGLGRSFSDCLLLRVGRTRFFEPCTAARDPSRTNSPEYGRSARRSRAKHKGSVLRWGLESPNDGGRSLKGDCGDAFPARKSSRCEEQDVVIKGHGDVAIAISKAHSDICSWNSLISNAAFIRMRIHSQFEFELTRVARPRLRDKICNHWWTERISTVDNKHRFQPRCPHLGQLGKRPDFP